MIREVKILLHARKPVGDQHLALLFSDSLVFVYVEIDGEPLSRSVIVNPRSSANLPSGLYSPVRIILHRYDAFNPYPLSLLY